MRIATLIIGLLLGLLMFLQVLLASAAGSLANNEAIKQAAALAFVAAILWLVGSALVLAFPLASTVIFLIAACFSFGAMATWSSYRDQGVWAVVAIILAIMSFFGWIGKRKERRRLAAERAAQLARDQRIEELLRAQKER